MNCEPSSTSGARVNFQGEIMAVFSEGGRSSDVAGKRGFYGQWFLRILAGGIIGFVAVGLAALILMMNHMVGWGVAVLLLGAILNTVIIKISHWILQKLTFLSLVTKEQGGLPALSFTRILQVKSASAGGGFHEVHLTSSREMNIRSPQPGDLIDLQGFSQGTKLHALRYRSGTQL